MRISLWRRWVVLGVGLALVGPSGCVVHRDLYPVAQVHRIDPDVKLLKVHMKDGKVYVLHTWSFDEATQTLSGEGTLLDVNRNVIGQGPFRIPADQIALLETHAVRPSASAIPMAMVTTASIGLTTFCLSNPKACFGSCPTFYVFDGETVRLQAEGFSASIAASLEATDVDMLYWAQPTGRELEVQMRNEALETHVVRFVNVLVAPRPAGGRVFKTPKGQFWQVDEIQEPTMCRASGEDCLPQIRAMDGVERWSPADATDLATREEIELEFHHLPPGRVGLVLGFRQSLLTTYLLYQAFAYTGPWMGDWLAALNRGDRKVLGGAARLARTLGAIEVFVAGPGNRWRRVGTVQEAGPIAPDVHLVPLPELKSKSPLRVRLRMTQGMYRLDYIALGRLVAPVAPLRLKPQKALWETADGTRRESPNFPDAGRTYAITYPGDRVTLIYALPEDLGPSYELFLEARGYYLEWPRQEWMQEYNPEMLDLLLRKPGEALRVLAPAYKELEDSMEVIFWRSRYARP